MRAAAGEARAEVGVSCQDHAKLQVAGCGCTALRQRRYGSSRIVQSACIHSRLAVSGRFVYHLKHADVVCKGLYIRVRESVATHDGDHERQEFICARLGCEADQLELKNFRLPCCD